MMKKFFTFVAISVFAVSAMMAQSTKKFVLLEHFTNSKCSICAGSNPAITKTYDKFPDYVHHISFHPSVPYSTCQFYQLNTIHNDARAAVYGVQGTPLLYLNGKPVSAAGLDAALVAEKNKKCVVRLDFTETTTATQVKLDYHAVTTDQPADIFKTYRFYVAAVEKLNTTKTPNGESVHRDVFYKFLGNTNTPEKGISYVLGNKGNDAFVKNIIFDVPAGKKGSDFYFLMWIQDGATLEVLTSGTKVDKTAGVQDVITDAKFEAYPNPATSELIIDLLNIEANPNLIEVYDVLGNTIISSSATKDVQKLDVSSFATGIYFVKVYTDNGILVKQIFKK